MGQLGLIQKGGDTNDTISGILCTIAEIFGVFRGIFRYSLYEMLQKATIIKKQRGIFPHVSRRENNHTHTILLRGLRINFHGIDCEPLGMGRTQIIC